MSPPIVVEVTRGHVVESRHDVDVAVAVEVAGPRVDGDLDPLYDRFVRPKFPIGSYVVHVEPHDVLVVHRRDDDVVVVVPVHVVNIIAYCFCFVRDRQR